MKTLTLPGVSFRKDPQALAILLYSLFDIAAHEDGYIAPECFEETVRSLGYLGSLNALVVHLIQDGFLSGSLRTGFLVTEQHYVQFRMFSRRYESGILPLCLTKKERVLLFEKISSHPDPVAMSTVRILRLMSALQDEFTNLAAFTKEDEERLAILQTDGLLRNEHLWWLTEQIDRRLHQLEEGVTSSGNDVGLFAVFQEAEDMQAELHHGVQTQTETQACVRSLHRSLYISELLRDMQKIFANLLCAFLDAESK